MTPAQKNQSCNEDMRLNPKPGVLSNLMIGIPQSHIVLLGKILGRFLYHFDISHRRVARRNIQFSHPEWQQSEITQLSKRFFQHFGIALLEMVQMGFFSREDMLSRIHVEGEEYVTTALRANKGIIVISAHLGNWEMGLQTAPCYFQRSLTGVAKRLRNARLEQVVYNYRTRFGNSILYKRGVLPDMMQVLRQGGILGLMMDVSRRFEGVEVKFFGRRATATPAAALLALRCKSPVIPVFCLRKADGKLTVEIQPPIKIIRTNDLRYDLQKNTQAISDIVEAAIRKNPEQWLWTLKRWKEIYPEIYPKPPARRLHGIKFKERTKRKVINDLN